MTPGTPVENAAAEGVDVERVFAVLRGASSQPWGPRREALCRRDLALHIRMLERARAGDDEGTFPEYCAWTAVFLGGLGVERGELAITLDALLDTIGREDGTGRAARALRAARERLGVDPLVTPAPLAVVPAAPAAMQEAATAGDAIRAGIDHLAGLILALSYMRWPETAIAHGERRFRGLEDAAHHLRQLAAGLDDDDDTMFILYAEWCQILLTGMGLDPRELINNLGALRDVLGIGLGAERARPAQAVVDRAIEHLRGDEVTLPSFLRPGAPLVDVARAYLDALLAGDRREASALVLAQADAGVPLEDLYEDVFLPAQYEVGRLWQTSQISIAREHFCTAATQMITSRLYGLIPPPKPGGRRVLSTCVGENLHELGSRFVADFFEMAGWTSFYLGASTPTAQVVDEVIDRKVDVLAISATLAEHLAGVRELVAAVRAEPAAAGVKILVGGYPFRVVPDLWRRFGADGSSASAREAVQLAEQLFEEADAT